MFFEPIFLCKAGNRRCFYLHDFSCTWAVLLICVTCSMSMGQTLQTLEVRGWAIGLDSAMLEKNLCSRIGPELGEGFRCGKATCRGIANVPLIHSLAVHATPNLDKAGSRSSRSYHTHCPLSKETLEQPRFSWVLQKFILRQRHEMK